MVTKSLPPDPFTYLATITHGPAGSILDIQVYDEDSTIDPENKHYFKVTFDHDPFNVTL